MGPSEVLASPAGKRPGFWLLSLAWLLLCNSSTISHHPTAHPLVLSHTHFWAEILTFAFILPGSLRPQVCTWHLLPIIRSQPEYHLGLPWTAGLKVHLLLSHQPVSVSVLFRGGKLFKNCIFFFFATLGPHCFTWAFSSCSKMGPLSSLSVQASHCRGFSCWWSTRALGFQQLWSMDLVAPQHMESFRTRDRTLVLCISRGILNHWSTREALCLSPFRHLALVPRTVSGMRFSVSHILFWKNR